MELDHPEDDCRKKAKRHYHHDGGHCGCDFHRKFLSVSCEMRLVLARGSCKRRERYGAGTNDPAFSAATFGLMDSFMVLPLGVTSQGADKGFGVEILGVI